MLSGEADMTLSGAGPKGVYRELELRACISSSNTGINDTEVVTCVRVPRARRVEASFDGRSSDALLESSSQSSQVVLLQGLDWTEAGEIGRREEG